MKRLLVVDDEKMVRESVENLFGSDYQVETMDSGNDAIYLLQNESFDLVLTDFNMRLGDGKDVANYCSGRGIPVIIMTGLALDKVKREAPRGVPVVEKLVLFDSESLEGFLP